MFVYLPNFICSGMIFLYTFARQSEYFVRWMTSRISEIFDCQMITSSCTDFGFSLLCSATNWGEVVSVSG